jgi:hypothetical protein
MADKATDIEKRGLSQENELGYELDDPRGRQGDKIVNKLYPTSAGGGGQTSQPAFSVRYRPGNRYRYVKLNGSVQQFNAVMHDLTFATEADRDAIVVNTAAAANQPCMGIWEQGASGPLATDPALASDPANTFGYATVHGKAIANVNAAVVAGDPLGNDAATAGRLSTLTAATPSAAEVARIMFQSSGGPGIRALVAEPPTQPSAFKANLTWVWLQ